MDKGVAQFGGNEELFVTILGYYVTDTYALLDAIGEITEESLAEYAKTAHGIKGSSRSVYAEEVGDAAEKLESAAKNGDLEYVAANNAAFVEQIRQLLHNIEDMVAARGAS